MLTNALLIMGIINVSPNSFFNAHRDLDSAYETAMKMIMEGADILDIGGEATNPFVDLKNDGPDVEEEINRVVPLIKKIKKLHKIFISVDTSRAEVMEAAIKAGADMINDQRALALPNALETVVKHDVFVCLMHWLGPDRQPGSCSKEALFLKIKKELLDSVKRCLNAGIKKNRIILDIGFGGGNFGKNTEENVYLLSRLSEFCELGYPVLSGWSRKSMLGEILYDALPRDRLFAGIAADTLAMQAGASIIRTHDVRATKNAASVVLAMTL